MRWRIESQVYKWELVREVSELAGEKIYQVPAALTASWGWAELVRRREVNADGFSWIRLEWGFQKVQKTFSETNILKVMIRKLFLLYNFVTNMSSSSKSSAARRLVALVRFWHWKVKFLQNFRVQVEPIVVQKWQSTLWIREPKPWLMTPFLEL